MSKYWFIPKAVLYIAAAVVILILHEQVMPYVGYLVGGVVLVYALEELVFSWIEKDWKAFSEAVVQLILAGLLFATSHNLVSVCTIWGVWSIIREVREMTGALQEIRKDRSGIVNIIESVVMIVLSVMMIVAPTYRHAHTHVILLAIELILEIVFPLVSILFTRRKKQS